MAAVLGSTLRSPLDSEAHDRPSGFAHNCCSNIFHSRKKSEKRVIELSNFEMTDSTMAMSNLPRDLAEEVLSRLPVTSLRAVRLTCKNWNIVSKRQSFTKKHIGKAKAGTKKNEFLGIMMMDFRVYLMSVNLSGIQKDDDNVESSIKRKGKLISLNDADGVDISRVFHCDGLLLCIIEDINSRLVVWNPYCGQTRWIKPRNAYQRGDRYALGYEKKKNSLRSHKILRFIDSYDWSTEQRICEFEIYNFDSDSWKVVDVTPDWYIHFYQHGVSVNGNTYWFAREKFKGDVGEIHHFLICFDFTREKFGKRLPLPFHANFEDKETLSSVGEKQLAVLFHHWGTLSMKIWITTKIEPNEVSWSKLFLSGDMITLTSFKFGVRAKSFFFDEEKKVAVFFYKGKDGSNPTQNIAYIIGENGYFKKMDLGESKDSSCCPFVCSYVPSSLQISQPARVIQQQAGKDHGILSFWCFVFSLFLSIILSYLCFR